MAKRVRLLSIAQVARRLHVSDRTVMRMIDSGKLPAIDVSGGVERRRFKVAEPTLAEWMQSGGATRRFDPPAGESAE